VVVSAHDVEIRLSLYCKRILAYAVEEAERLHHRHIDLGHLLIGVVREEHGIAGEILRSAGLNVGADVIQMSK
jgi:ATP-dependent Clp protease ATP-binding subunit ClpC